MTENLPDVRPRCTPPASFLRFATTRAYPNQAPLQQQESAKEFVEACQFVIVQFSCIPWGGGYLASFRWNHVSFSWRFQTNRFVQTLSVVGTVALAVIVSRAFSQTSVPPSSDSIYYDECVEKMCDDSDMQGGHSNCIGRSPCNGLGQQYRGTEDERMTYSCSGATDPDTELNKLTAGCGRKEFRVVNCQYNPQAQQCQCTGGSPTGWIDTGNPEHRYDTIPCDDNPL